NHRKRSNSEKADLILNGGKDVIKAMLPIIDDMERALQSIPEDNNAREGIQLILNKLLATLAQKGLRPMEAQNQRFDENLHEAVTRIPATSDDQKGLVIDVVEKGYFLNDKVLRFAKVVVAC
ncbi:MAG: nucleotide exchange factor GrpE, partial [Bacteroidales bacterium]|nr:nucleotide exchange factor GrpE [Bacteroidales bacterium]